MPSGKYFATILYEVEEPRKLELLDCQIGIDLGLKEFAVCSDGEVIENPRNTKKYSDKLSWKQRSLSRKQKGSNRRNDARIQVAKIHEKIANSRKDFQQKLSTRLINENQVICLETLKPSNMIKNHKLAKAISDASWSSFVSMLKYKAEWYGRSIIQISPYYPSSQLCSHCGFKFKGTKDLGVRVWECPKCHEVNERDLNASINILNEGLKTFKLRSEGPLTHGDTENNSSLDRESTFC
jgi:putative transposase